MSARTCDFLVPAGKDANGCESVAVAIVADYYDIPPRGRHHCDAYACAACANRLETQGWVVLFVLAEADL